MSNKAEKLRYQSNGLGFSLVMLAMVFALIAMFRVINIYYFDITTNPAKTVWPNLAVGISIVIDIILLLLSFLSAEKVKNYRKQWSYVLYAIAAYSIIKIFTLPLPLFINKHLSLTDYIITGAIYVVAAALYVYAGMMSYKKSVMLEKYLETVK